MSEACTARLIEIVQWLARHVEMDAGGGSTKSQWVIFEAVSGLFYVIFRHGTTG